MWCSQWQALDCPGGSVGPRWHQAGNCFLQPDAGECDERHADPRAGEDPYLPPGRLLRRDAQDRWAYGQGKVTPPLAVAEGAGLRGEEGTDGEQEVSQGNQGIQTDWETPGEAVELWENRSTQEEDQREQGECRSWWEGV